MDWIKKNPAQLALTVIALAILASSYLLWQNISGFAENFTGGRYSPTLAKGIPPLDVKAIDDAGKSIKAPAIWNFDAAGGLLFVSDVYVKDGTSIKKPEGEVFQPPVPNDWLKKYGLNYLDPGVLQEDPDKDGFNTLLEFMGMDATSHLTTQPPYKQPVMGADGKALPDDSTSPIDAKSHPPYHTRLTLAPLPNGDLGIVNIPFRLKFMSVDINPRDAKDITFQVNTIDKGARTRFVPIGQMIPETPYKATKFEKKERPGKDGTVDDISEMTIVNPVTGKVVVLPMGLVVDSPESFVSLRYLWVAPGGQPTPDMNKKKDDTFTLPPESDKIYKVVDIKAAPADKSRPGEVTILLPTGATLVLTTTTAPVK